MTTLKKFLKGLADAIRTKEESSALINAQDFEQRILNIETGVDTTDATATSKDILLGKTAYVDEVKVEGAIEIYDGSYEGNGANGDETIINTNIDRAKLMDMQNLVVNGGTIPSDEEYMANELKCQELYNKILGGA